jgi:hypothetical protein
MVNNTTRNAIIVVAVIAVGYFVLTGNGTADLLDQSGGAGIPTIGTFDSKAVSQDEQVYNGDLTIKTIAVDASDASISYAGDTEFTTICYKDNGSSDVSDWTNIGTGSSANPEVITVPVSSGSATSGGLVEMWCEVSITSGQDYYFDKDAVIRDNSRISTAIFDDPSNTNIDNWIYHVDLSGVSVADPNTTPTMSIFYDLLDEGSLTVDSPTSLLSVGTGSVENRIKWSIDMDNKGDSESINRVQIRIDDTDDSLWSENQSYVTVPNFGQIKLSEMNPTIIGSNTVYKYTFGTDYATGNMISIDKNGDTEVDIPVIIQSTLTSGADLCIELEIRTVDAFGVYTSSSDDVELIDSATNSAECTIT